MTKKTTTPKTAAADHIADVRKMVTTETQTLFVGQSTTSSTHSGTDAEGAPVKTADFVTDLFNLLEKYRPEIAGDRLELERAVRVHFGGARPRITHRPDPDTTAARVLSLFNGRNARTVARVLGISRMEVYRCLKQPGTPKK